MPAPSPLSPFRIRLVATAALVIALGLSSRRYPLAGNYPGDALWATLVFLLWAFLLPRTPGWRLATVTFATALLVELSQLYHAPWLDQLRQTAFGKLALGSGFDPIDLLAYALGTLLGWITHRFVKPS